MLDLLTAFFVTDCIGNKQLATQSSHIIQLLTDLTHQVTELNKSVQSILLGRPGERVQIDPAEADMEELFATLPVKDDASFEHFNNKIKLVENKQVIVCRKSHIII